MNKKRCFAFFSTLINDPWGGCEDLWYKTALRALKDHHKVIVVVFKHDETPSHILKLIQNGADIFYFERRHAHLTLKKRIRNRYFPFYNQRKTLKKIEAILNEYSSVSILISQAGSSDFSYNYLDGLGEWLLRTKHPFDVVVHNVPDLGFLLQPETIEKQRKVFEKARFLCYVSRRNLESSERYFAQKLSNSLVVNNPLNFEQLPDHLPFPPLDGPILFAEVAALRCTHKGQDILLQVLGNERWKNRNWKLNLYGGGNDGEYLKKLVKFYGLEDRVFFKGHVSDIKTVWQNNHIHVLPSLGEGTPLALIESMLCARPAITTDVGGNTEYCTHMESGFIACYPTLNGLTEVMELAWENRPKWAQMGIEARKAILDKYDLDAVNTLYKILMGIPS